MSNAFLTVMGLNNYDPTLFNGLTFPAGINKDIAVDEIILRSGEFTVLYTDPDFMKLAIEHWGKKHYRTFEKWVEALAIEFEPLYNYDRYEEYTDDKIAQGNQKTKTSDIGSTAADSINSSIVSNENKMVSDGKTIGNAFTAESTTGSESDKNTEKGSSLSQTNTNSSSDDTNNRNVAAYDSSTMTPREQEIKNNTSGQMGNGFATNESESEKTGSTNTNTSSLNQNNSTNENETKASSNQVDHTEGKNKTTSTDLGEHDTQSNNIEKIKHTAHLYGNIGVTTSSALLEEYIRVERFNIYEQIANIFVDEFCIQVY